MSRPAQTSKFGMFAYLVVVNDTFAQLACCQVALPFSKRTTPGTLSLEELAPDNKFGYLLPHKSVRIVVLK